MIAYRIKTAIRAPLTGGAPRRFNIVGLALGFAGIFLVMILHYHETTYDSWLDNADRIYRLETSLYNINGDGRDSRSALAPPALGPELATTLPYVESAVRIFRPAPFEVTLPDGSPGRSIINFVDPDFFSFFNLPLLEGDRAALFSRPDHAVLTEAEARRLFGTDNPVGRTVEIAGGAGTVTVSGVLKALPARTHFRFFGIIAPNTSPLSGGQQAMDGFWDQSLTLTYVRTEQPGAESRLKSDIERIFQDKYPGGNRRESPNYRGVDVLNIQDIRLNTKSSGIYMKPRGDVDLIKSLWLIGIGILFICIINFINIENTVISKNKKEIMIKKINGCSPYQEFTDTITKLTFICVISIIISIAIIYLFIPYYSNYLDININNKILFDKQFLFYVSLIFMTVLILTSIYPSILSAYTRPVNMTIHTKGFKGRLFRQFFLVLQFSIVTFFIFTSVIVLSQMAHLRSLDRGIVLDDVFQVTVDTGTEDGLDVLEAGMGVETAFETHARTGFELPIRSTDVIEATRMGGDVALSGLSVSAMHAGPGLPELFSFQPIAGRWFDAARQSDELAFRREGRTGAAVLSVQAAQAFGFSKPEEAIRKTLQIFDGARAQVEIIGVVPDILWGDGKTRFPPKIYLHDRDREDMLVFRSQPGQEDIARQWLAETWESVKPGAFLEAMPLPDAYDAAIRDERTRFQAFGVFAFLAVLISCIGLYGLTLHYVHRQGKEIALRKLFGANLSRLFLALTLRYMRPVAVSVFIGLPFAYLYNRDWLLTYAERIRLGTEPFVISAVMVVTIALATSASLILRASTRPPVEFLHME